GSVDATNANASVEWGEPYHAGIRGGASVWYAWTAPASGPVSFQTASSANTLLAVYDTSGVEVASNHKPLVGATTYASRLVFSATAGRQYLIAVDTVGTRYESPSGGTFTLSWRQPPTPPNDNFANAADLGTGRSAFDDQDGNVGATTEAGEPAIIGLAPSTSVWFKWSPAFLYRTVTVSTRGSDFDTVLAVYTGSGLSSLKQLAADDDSGGGGTSSASFVVDGSGPYWTAVGGQNGAAGRIVLSVSVSQAP